MFIFNVEDKEYIARCPFGTEDDILWVRETWESYTDQFLTPPGITPWPAYSFMPRATCRIFLRIKGINPGRLRDVLKEGSSSRYWKRNEWVFVIDVVRIDPKQYAAENKKFAKWAEKGGLKFG